MKHLKNTSSLIIFGIFLIFAIQNNISVDFKFLMFKIPQIPLFVISIVIFIIGFILGRITEWFSYLFNSRSEKNEKNK
ncbi:MAG: DUF1049 domain-containing protein [Spirochaetota bacterium]|nr:DUF1049 domain-containing protein [Spirochaetota bacterium]